MAEIVVHDRFNPPSSPGLDCSGDPGYTQQEFKDDADINRIMKRALGSGELPPNVKVGSYGDFYDAPTFLEAMQIMQHAQDQFAALPAKVRERFQNDPAKLLEWLPTASLDEANELGLLKEETSARLAKEAAAELAKAQRDAADLVEFRKGEQVKVSTLKTTP